MPFWRTAGAVLFVAAAAATLHAFHIGPLSHGMAIHILLMNAIAPAVAADLRVTRTGAHRLPLGTLLVAATALQLVALWGWHAPPALGLASRSMAAHAAMQLSLLATAILFWAAVYLQQGVQRWRAIFALLVTGKLVCLLGVILVFAPRPLYGVDPLSMPDQHLAGLLMLGACPLTYVLAGIVIAARWLDELGAEDAPREATLNLANDAEVAR